MIGLAFNYLDLLLLAYSLPVPRYNIANTYWRTSAGVVYALLDATTNASWRALAGAALPSLQGC